jgi:SAM-dependent methyltransferase
MSKLSVVNSKHASSQKQTLIGSLKKEQEALWAKRFYSSFPFVQKRYFNWITSSLPEEAIKGIDIGCGDGYYALGLLELGKEMYACDIATAATSLCSDKLTGRITSQALPYLQEEDFSYDFALALNLIPELPSHLHRLALSDIARILKKNAYAFFSARLERQSLDSLQKFAALICTEFTILRADFLHLRYWYTLRKVFPFWKNPVLFESICNKIFPLGSYSDVFFFCQKKSLYKEDSCL